MEWDTGMDLGQLLEEVFPPVLNNEFHEFFLDDGNVCSFEQLPWLPSPFPPTSKEITEGIGQLDLNSNNGNERTAKLATSETAAIRRGRPKKPLSKEVLRQRQKDANRRERKRMSDLTILFKELKNTLPRNDQILSKKDILAKALSYIDELRCNNGNC